MHPKSIAPRAGGVVVLATLLVASTTHAGPIPVGVHTDTQALEWLTGGSISSDSDTDAGTTGPRTVAASAAFNPGTTATDTSGKSDYGFLQVVTETVGTYESSSGHLMNAQGISHASFREDSVVVNAPGFGPGQFGSFTAQFQINHDVDFMGTVNSSNGGRLDITGGFQLEVNVGSAHPGPYGGTPWIFSTVSGSSAPTIPSGIISVPVSFEYGVPFTISADLEINLFTSLSGEINADVDASMNLGSAFFWQGIDKTTLPDDVTVSSDHVEDWTLPYDLVPAPASLTLLPLAGAAVLRRRRRR